MEDEKIIKMFIKDGFQLSKDGLDLIRSDPEHFLSEVKKLEKRPFIITKKQLESLATPKLNFKLVKKAEPNKMSATELSEFYLSHYKKIKNIIKNTYSLENLISINNISEKKEHFTIVCMVREKGKKNILVEDMSGEIHIHFDSKKHLEKIFNDDVLGFYCKYVKDKVFVEKTYFPHPKISREVRKTKTPFLINVFNNNYLGGGDISIVFSEETKDKNTITIDKNFRNSLYSVNHLNILIVSKTAGKNEISRIPGQLVVWGDNTTNNLELNEAPDIIITNIGENFYLNDRGTTIVSSSVQTKYFQIDLNTREVLEKKINP